MPLLRAVPVVLSAGERTALKKRVRGAKTAWRDRLRAQIVLAAARGRDNARIAADLRVSVDTVRKWRGRFARRGLDGLADLPRSGRPRRISELTRAAVVALACQLPAATGVPLSRWTGPELLAEITKAGAGGDLSASSVLRILAEHPVKPWQYQSWISPRDPDFAAKATVILDLYQGFYQGRRLRPGDRILSVDAKPSIQARGRCRPTAPARPGKTSGCSGAGRPASTSASSPGRKSSGTGWSPGGRLPTIPPSPGTGSSGDAANASRSTRRPGTCCAASAAGARSAGDCCCTPTASPRARRNGSSGTPSRARRSASTRSTA